MDEARRKSNSIGVFWDVQGKFTVLRRLRTLPVGMELECRDLGDDGSAVGGVKSRDPIMTGCVPFSERLAPNTLGRRGSNMWDRGWWRRSRGRLGVSNADDKKCEMDIAEDGLHDASSSWSSYCVDLLGKGIRITRWRETKTWQVAHDIGKSKGRLK